MLRIAAKEYFAEFEILLVLLCNGKKENLVRSDMVKILEKIG